MKLKTIFLTLLFLPTLTNSQPSKIILSTHKRQTLLNPEISRPIIAWNALKIVCGYGLIAVAGFYTLFSIGLFLDVNLNRDKEHFRKIANTSATGCLFIAPLMIYGGSMLAENGLKGLRNEIVIES